jgi:hypothetical protein
VQEIFQQLLESGETKKLSGNENQQREQIFQETMKSMKLVIYQEDHEQLAKIYYLDGVKNVARLLIDQIQLLKIDDELHQHDKKIYSPKFS